MNYLIRILLKPHHFKLWRDWLQYLEKEYFGKYLQLDNNEAEKIGTWRFISIMQKWIDTWQEEVVLVFWDKTVLSVGIVVSLFYIAQSSVLFLLFILWIAVFAIPRISFFGKKAIVLRRKSKGYQIEWNRIFVRRLMSKFEILQQGKFLYETEKKYTVWKNWYNAKFKEKIRQWLWYDTIVFLAKCFVVVIAFFVWKWAIDWTYTLSDFVLLTGLWSIVSKDLFSILQQVRKTMDSFVHIEKLRDTFDSLGTIKWYEEWKKFTYLAWKISLKDLSYSYGEKPVFQNFSLDIQAWKKTAFVWLSGAGKTTLIKLIAWYLQPTWWSIIVDWQDLSETALKTYYQSVWYLTQEPSVFDGTIKENLMYSLPSDVSIESIKEKVDYALKKAKCDFVYDLEKWIDTEIGERWVRLSWWQKQRLAIAKIFLKDPKIIILDEPTSALDSFSEEAITEAMHNLYDWRTVLIIAHRLQTVKEADEIIVLDYNEKTQSSEVIEHWTHDGLVNENWFYAKMLEVQTWF